MENRITTFQVPKYLRRTLKNVTLQKVGGGTLSDAVSYPMKMESSATMLREHQNS